MPESEVCLRTAVGSRLLKVSELGDHQAVALKLGARIVREHGIHL